VDQSLFTLPQIPTCKKQGKSLEVFNNKIFLGTINCAAKKVLLYFSDLEKNFAFCLLNRGARPKLNSFFEKTDDVDLLELLSSIGKFNFI